MNRIKRILRPLLMIFSAFLAIALCAHAQASELTVTHIVRPGETLQVISQHYYGTTRRWSQIYKNNRSVLKTPQTVAPGMKITLHIQSDSKLATRALRANKMQVRSPAQVQVESLDSNEAPSKVMAPAGGIPQTHGLLPNKDEAPAPVAAVVAPRSAPEAVAPTALAVTESDPAAELADVPAPVAQAPKTARPVAFTGREKLIEIRVRAEDTLESLAEQHMGSAKFWPRIIELNHKILREPEDLQPGMTLQIETLLPHPAAAQAVRPADQFSAIEVASIENRPQTVEAPGTVSAQASPNRGLPHYDEFIDP